MLLAGGFEGRHYIYDEATNTISNGRSLPTTYSTVGLGVSVIKTSVA